MWMGEEGGLVGTRYMSGEDSMLTKIPGGYEVRGARFSNQVPKGNSWMTCGWIKAVADPSMAIPARCKIIAFMMNPVGCADAVEAVRVVSIYLEERCTVSAHQVHGSRIYLI